MPRPVSMPRFPRSGWRELKTLQERGLGCEDWLMGAENTKTWSCGHNCCNPDFTHIPATACLDPSRNDSSLGIKIRSSAKRLPRQSQKKSLQSWLSQTFLKTVSKVQRRRHRVVPGAPHDVGRRTGQTFELSSDWNKTLRTASLYTSCIVKAW